MEVDQRCLLNFIINIVLVTFLELSVLSFSQNNTNIHLNVNAKNLIKSLRLFISQVPPHWIWGGIHEPQRKKGEKKNLTPHRPIGS